MPRAATQKSLPPHIAATVDAILKPLQEARAELAEKETTLKAELAELHDGLKGIDRILNAAKAPETNGNGEQAKRQRRPAGEGELKTVSEDKCVPVIEAIKRFFPNGAEFTTERLASSAQMKKEKVYPVVNYLRQTGRLLRTGQSVEDGRRRFTYRATDTLEVREEGS